MLKRGESRRALRLLLCLAGLLTTGLAALSVIVAHQNRIRGLPEGFAPPVAGADVPILGVNVALEQYHEEELENALIRIAEAGFVWIRQPFYLSLIESEPDSAQSSPKDHYDWSATDRFMAALARHPQLRLVAVLDNSPPTPPADPDRFAAFAGALAARYGAQIDYYQVWDEPNLADHWGSGPVSPPAYADLLARTARAIRAADCVTATTPGPAARVLLAGLAPTTETGPQNLSDVRYLEQLYRAGAAPYFDIVVGKPYGFDTGPDDRRAPKDGTVLNFSRLLLLREVMVEHGDADKAIWASHWGWNALPPDWTGLPSLWGQTDETTQAALTVAALERARAEWPWVGALILEHFQPALPPDDPHWGFALVGQDGNPRPVYDAVAGWAAALPDAAPTGGYPALDRWATYEGDWRVGLLGADVGASGDRAIFRFVGTSVALTVRRGPYLGFLYATVDGAPANGLPHDEAGRAYLVLHDSDPAIATVPIATSLPRGTHTVEVIAEGGQGQWALVDWRVGAEPIGDGHIWKIAALAGLGLGLTVLVIRDTRRMTWAAMGHQFLNWPEWTQVATVVGLVGLLWLAAGASWGRGLPPAPHSSPIPCSPPSSYFFLILSLLTLPTLAALFTLRPDLGLAAIALSAPFYLQPGDMFYHVLSLPEVLILLCAMAIALRKLRAYGSTNSRTRKERTVRLSPIDWAVLLLLVAAVIAGLAAADWRAALFELRTVLLLPALYYALLRSSAMDEPTRWRILDALVLGAVSVALIGLGQYAFGRNVVVAEGGLPRLQSVYYSPNNVGLYLGRAWPLLVAVLVWGKRGHRRRLYGLALAAVTLALGFSFSRGALLLGLPAALVAMSWQAGRRYRWLALALVVIGVLALVPLLSVPRFAALLDLQQGSTFFRLELWRSSLTLIREHPWFGVGPGNFLEAYRTRYVLPSAWEEFNLEHPHNVYLDHWTRLGLLGLVAGVAVQVAFFKLAKQRISESASTGGANAPLSLGLLGSMVALLAHGLVDNTLFFIDLALVFFLTLALAQKSEIPRARSVVH